MVQGVPPTQESLCEAPSSLPTSSSLHFHFSVLSLPLILTFTTHDPLCGLRGYSVRLQSTGAVWAHCFSTFHWYFAILGSPFSTPPHRESPYWKALRLTYRVETLVSSPGWLTWCAVLFVPKPDRSKYSVCLRASLLPCIRLKIHYFIAMST